MYKSVVFHTFTMVRNHHLHWVPEHFHHPKGTHTHCPLCVLPEALGMLLTCSAPPMGLSWAGSLIWPAGRIPAALWHGKGPRDRASQWSETVWSLGFHEHPSASPSQHDAGKEQRKTHDEQRGENQVPSAVSEPRIETRSCWEEGHS